MINFLLTTYYDTLKGYARVLSGNSYDADDLTQDTALRILERPNLVPEDSDDFLPWAKRVMKNIFLNSKRREEMKDLDDIEEPREEENCRKEAEELLQTLPGNQRELLGLSLQGYTQKEISGRLGIPEGTVKTRMAKAKMNLKQFPNK